MSVGRSARRLPGPALRARPDDADDSGPPCKSTVPSQKWDRSNPTTALADAPVYVATTLAERILERGDVGLVRVYSRVD